MCPEYVVDVLVAEFREAIKHSIPEIIKLLWNAATGVRNAAADALLILSEQGNISSFLT